MDRKLKTLLKILFEELRKHYETQNTKIINATGLQILEETLLTKQ